MSYMDNTRVEDMYIRMEDEEILGLLDSFDYTDMLI